MPLVDACEGVVCTLSGLDGQVDGWSLTEPQTLLPPQPPTVFNPGATLTSYPGRPGPSLKPHKPVEAGSSRPASPTKLPQIRGGGSLADFRASRLAGKPRFASSLAVLANDSRYSIMAAPYLPGLGPGSYATDRGLPALGPLPRDSHLRHSAPARDPCRNHTAFLSSPRNTLLSSPGGHRRADERLLQWQGYPYMGDASPTPAVGGGGGAGAGAGAGTCAGPGEGAVPSGMASSSSSLWSKSAVPRPHPEDFRFASRLKVALRNVPDGPATERDAPCVDARGFAIGTGTGRGVRAATISPPPLARARRGRGRDTAEAPDPGVFYTLPGGMTVTSTDGKTFQVQGPQVQSKDWKLAQRAARCLTP
ncbi:hypothetical protein FOA52_015391 [Chlamydomonas sp. UWO 241]|nr:hypothetical protein FOA52_015391 [Chlamydomonas sp. UWO 241]